MSKHKIYISEHQTLAIGQEVHVDDLGPERFYTVRKIHNSKAFLSRRRSEKVIYIRDVTKCYFTNRTAKLIESCTQSHQNKPSN